jgi:hypothetical protein
MSSTEADRLGRFFDKRLLPLAEKLRARGARFFPMGPDPQASTYYIAPRRDRPEFCELEDAAACEKALRDLWEGQKMPELAALAGPILELARQVEIREEESGEISPFVYVMY